MQVIEFDRDKFARTKRCFDDDICEISTIMFHGTSNIFEQSIEERGFKCEGSNFVDAEVIEKVLYLFQRLRWQGIHRGGYPVLSSYSKRDYKNDLSGYSPIFFAESSYRAMLYATRDFAVGEAARAMLYSLNDLEQFVTKKEIQDSHFETLKIKHEEWSDKAHPSFLKEFEPEIGMDELSLTVNSFKGLKDKIAKLRAEYEYGVVYAVDVAAEPNLLPSLKIRAGNGIEASCLVPNHTIKAKCIIPKNHQHDGFNEDPDRMSFFQKPNGLYSAIKRLDSAIESTTQDISKL